MKYKSDKIKLESIGPENVHLLVNFTLDPIAQGAYKKYLQVENLILIN